MSEKRTQTTKTVEVELFESYRAWSNYRKEKGYPPTPAGRPKKSPQEGVATSTAAAPPLVVNGTPTPSVRRGGEEPTHRFTLPTPPADAVMPKDNGKAHADTANPGADATEPRTDNAKPHADTANARPRATIEFPPESPPGTPEVAYAFSAKELRAALVLLKLCGWDRGRVEAALGLVYDFRLMTSEEVRHG